MAEAVADSAAVPLLKQSLTEERAMADWIKARIASTTETFLSLLRQGQRAGV